MIRVLAAILVLAATGLNVSFSQVTTAVDLSPQANSNPQQSMLPAGPLQSGSDQPALVSDASAANQVFDSTQGMPDIAFGPSSGEFGTIGQTNRGINVGSNFFGLGDNFDEGLLIRNKNVAMKIGGYLKADLIQDFNPITNTDAFDVTTIEVGAQPRTNTRFHARQTRLNLDTRWNSEAIGPVRFFVEGDFFFNQRESFELGTDRFRLRHAYGQFRKWKVGQTWSTFSDVAASPPTLDFEGQVASVNVRRAQVRWTDQIGDSDWRVSVALEDPFAIVDLPSSLGRALTETPDLVVRMRNTRPNNQFQVSAVLRRLGFQPFGAPDVSDISAGLNFTNVMRLSPQSKFYCAVVYGSGIGSFRGLPDIGAVNTPEVGRVLNVSGWMVGATRDWNKYFSSNLTFAESRITNTRGLSADQLNNVTYLAANLIFSPDERIEVGIEYLYGKRENVDGQSGLANRIQASVIFYLP